MKWELNSALIGFTQLNNAHNGIWLGQALFKIAKQMEIKNKVSIFWMIGGWHCLSIIIFHKDWPYNLQ
jgi:hypothetical protein